MGHLYWWLVAPFHRIVFGSMTRNIAEAAETLQNQADRSDEESPRPVAHR
jgi:hypothetical protein